MQLIVAGLGRSGTTSLFNALEQLGFKTMSQDYIFANSTVHAHMNGVVRGRETFVEQDFEGFQASVGWPMCWAVKEQMELFPEAKVLLNYRDTDAWVDSVSRALKTLSIVRKLRFMSKLKHINETLDMLFERMGGGKFEPERWKRGYEEHKDQIRSIVPADKLTEYDVTEGWEPLCNLLGVPVPDTPFPRENVGGVESLKEKLSSLFGIGDTQTHN
ncbi:MAG TPA: hypothetical protein DCR93_21945 [Cytophagales bacterium]|nr:hypothetical protein [Cytophagales bacterium]HAP62044.1 hypothetical protein [Cytophagales bacterium]